MMNQCDGCRQKAPIIISSISKSRLHVDKNGRAFMACTSYRYKKEFTEKMENGNLTSTSTSGTV